MKITELRKIDYHEESKSNDIIKQEQEQNHGLDGLIPTYRGLG